VATRCIFAIETNYYMDKKKTTKVYIYLALAVIILAFYMPPAFAAINLNVTVEGVEDAIKKNVLAYLSIEQQKKHQDLNEHLLHKLYHDAPDEIRRALQPFGYYSPIIHSELNRDGSAWNALYRIDKGSPVLIDTLDLSIKGEGSEDERLKSLKAKLPLKTGDILINENYEEE